MPIRRRQQNPDDLQDPMAARTKRRLNRSQRRQLRDERRQEARAEERAREEAEVPRVRPLVPKTPGQGRVLDALHASGDVFAVGPAGSGKTFLCVGYGARLVASGNLQRLVLARPAVSLGEKHGFVPGKLDEKLAPWLSPVLDAVDKAIGKASRESWVRSGKILVESIEHLQGKTFDASFMVMDEAQNATPSQLESFLTRTGQGSRYAICGDPFAQKAIEGKSGMLRALELVAHHRLPVIVAELTHDDIVRSAAAAMWARAFSEDHGPGEYRALLDSIARQQQFQDADAD